MEFNDAFYKIIIASSYLNTLFLLLLLKETVAHFIDYQKPASLFKPFIVNELSVPNKIYKQMNNSSIGSSWMVLDRHGWNLASQVLPRVTFAVIFLTIRANVVEGSQVLQRFGRRLATGLLRSVDTCEGRFLSADGVKLLRAWLVLVLGLVIVSPLQWQSDEVPLVAGTVIDLAFTPKNVGGARLVYCLTLGVELAESLLVASAHVHGSFWLGITFAFVLVPRR